MLRGDMAICRCEIRNNNVYDDVDDDDEDDDNNNNYNNNNNNNNNNAVGYVMRPILLVMWRAF